MNLQNFLSAGYKHKGAGEYAGPCPRCGGEDRFVFWPEHSSGAAGGKFLCRQCYPAGGDAIAFLRDFRGMSYREACETLRLPAGSAGQKGNRAAAPASKTAPVVWTPKDAAPPPDAWQAAAAAFLSECCRNIEGEAAAAFLQGRGLNLDTARRFQLGWNPADVFASPEDWGLEPWKNAKGNPGRVFLPAGAVIPIRRKAGLFALNIRRAVVPDGQDKYHLAKGSRRVAFIHGKPGLPCVIVESELDAALIAQEAPGLCSVVAIPAGDRPDTQTAAFIRAAPLVLFAGDYDEAGKKAFRWWRANFPFCRVCPPVAGKDVTDMHRAGFPVLDWLELDLEHPHATRPPASSYGRENAKADACPTPAENRALNADYWRSVCADYWRGCLSCPDVDMFNRQDGKPVELKFPFCKRHKPCGTKAA